MKTVKSHQSMRQFAPLALALALSAFAASAIADDTSNASRIKATTHWVNKTADTSDGVCDQDCSLREAIAFASAGDKIGFASMFYKAAQTITLSQGELLLARDLSIVGPGEPLTISANNLGRVFRISGAAVSIDGLNIRGGRVLGSENGAGILNQGTLQLSHCAISDNRTETAGNGGGIWNSGILEISDCEIKANEAGRGGAIYSNGTANISRSLIQNNFATSGGGIFAGELQPVGALVLSNSTIRNNLATDFGAGLYVQVQKARIENSTINGNIAREQGAGIYFISVETRRALQLINSTVSGNLAGVRGGGIGSDAFGLGGTALEISGCTIVFNTAGTGGGVDTNASAQAHANTEVRSSIFFQNTGGNLLANPGLGAMQSQGFNLSDDLVHDVLKQSSDLLGRNPLLAPLANNGGRNQTHALLAGSPALDQGHSFGSNTDQRGIGFVRIFDSALIANAIGGDGADIGTIEAQDIK